MWRYMGVKTNPSKLWYGSSEYNRREQLAQFVTYVQTIKPWHLFVDRKDLRCSVIAQAMQWSKGRWNTEVSKNRSQEPGYLFCCPQTHVFMFVFLMLLRREGPTKNRLCRAYIRGGQKMERGKSSKELRRSEQTQRLRRSILARMSERVLELSLCNPRELSQAGGSHWKEVGRPPCLWGWG